MYASSVPLDRDDAQLPRCNEIDSTKTNNMSVLGNVNDLVWHYQMSVLDYGNFKRADVDYIIHKLNRMPQKNIG
jgi:hypothetical protein